MWKFLGQEIAWQFWITESRATGLKRLREALGPLNSERRQRMLALKASTRPKENALFIDGGRFVAACWKPAGVESPVVSL